MQGQYDILKHSILPLIYKIIGPNHHIYPATKSLLLFNPLFHTLIDKGYSIDTEAKHLKWLIDHIKNIEAISQSKLSHIICNHSKFREQYNRFSLALEKFENRRDVKLLLPNPNENPFNIKPQLVGEVSVCFIPAQGYYHDYNLIGVTHISQSSTKVPVLFVEDLIRVSSINYDYFNQQITDEGYLKSLRKVHYFPNQTYIFPSRLAQRADLLFAKAMVTNSKQSSKALPLLEEKIKIFEKNNLDCPDCLIPTTVYEEKHLNPFMQADKYGQLLGVKVKDSGKIFKLLSEIRKQWKN